jgi:protein SCO1/2
MTAPCRLAIGASRALESCAASHIARRTFASQSSTSISAPRTVSARRTQCLREAQKISAGSASTANSLQRQTRSFTHSAPRSKLKTIDQIKARNKGGVRLYHISQSTPYIQSNPKTKILTWQKPFNLTAALLFLCAGGGLYAYFTYEKERMARKRIADQTKGIGKPKVGGPFTLVDQNGKVFGSEDMLGKYSLVRELPPHPLYIHGVERVMKVESLIV